jgi:tripartite-type tricarboxylate transporter receptor subunit TctC
VAWYRVIVKLLAPLMPLLACSFLPSSATAQTPGRAISIVVPYTAGAGPDILARIIGEELTQRWGQPVIVDNKPGASGNIGTQQAMRAAPDGHTVLMTTNPFANNVSLFKNIPYDPQKSFAPILQVGVGALALAVHPSVPVATTREFVDYVKARPGEINYGSPGIGTPHHLAMELFKITTNTKLSHVPYRGSAGATQDLVVKDLVGGHVSAGFQAVHVIWPMAQQNQIRLLGAAGRERVAIAPDLPTLQEQGISDFDVSLWYGMLLPAGTSRDIIERYNKEINDILRKPEVVEKLAKQGLTVTGGTPERFAQFIAGEVAKWRAVVNEAGIAAE